jgi:hypothetical protein
LPGGAVPVWAARALSVFASPFFVLGGNSPVDAVLVAAPDGAAGRRMFPLLEVIGFDPVTSRADRITRAGRPGAEPASAADRQ